MVVTSHACMTSTEFGLRYDQNERSISKGWIFHLDKYFKLQFVAIWDFLAIMLRLKI